MEKEIYTAVANLPEHLVTPEIAQAAIEEGNLKLLDCLPHRYLTEEAVMSIINRNEKSYCWDSFRLSNIPEPLRSEQLCEFAVKKDTDNILHVPENLRSLAMLEKMLERKDAGLKYLHLFRPSLWSAELVRKGISSVYTRTYDSYRSGRYGGSQTAYDIKRVQILLSFVPIAILNRQFYLDLFSVGLKAEDMNAF